MNSQIIQRQVRSNQILYQYMKYNIVFEMMGNECIDFTVVCMIQKSFPLKYQSKLLQGEMDDSTKQLFPSLADIYNYLCLEPNMLSFDDILLEVCIKVGILGQFKYIYLPILEENRHKMLQQRLIQVIQEKAALDTENDAEKKNLALTYSQNLQEQQKYWAMYKQNGRHHKKLTFELQQIETELIKVGKTIIMHEDGIANSLKNNNRELRQNLKIQKEGREQRRLLVHSYQLSKLNHPKIASLMNGNIQTLIDIDLNGSDLKSMKFVEIFVNLKEMRLSQNNIKRIDGLFYINSLSILDLSHNRIQKIQNLERNINISVLILHSNLITKIENLFHLYKLQVLSLSNNSIEQIPEEIQLLYSLAELRIINNRLNILPSQLYNMKAIRVLSILGNPCFSSQHKCSVLIDKLVVNKKVMTGCGAF